MELFKAIIRKLYLGIALQLLEIRMWIEIKIMYIIARISKDPEDMQAYRVAYYRFTHH